MDTTSSQLPICIHCGTPRPADESLCPACGKPWIDTKIDPPESTPPETPAPGADMSDTTELPVAPIPAPPPPDLDDTGEFFFEDWTDPPEEKRRRTAVWLIPVVVAAAAAAAVWALVFLDSGTTATTTTVAALPETTTSQTTPPTTTTEPKSSATQSTTTTTISFAQPSDWEALGTATPTDELTLKAAGIGPIAIGSSAQDVAGALTASLGEADSAGVATLCPNQESYWLQWGALKAFFDGDTADSVFLEYRYEDIDAVEPHATLTTLSGVALGDTVADLQSTYASYTVSFEVIDSQDHFRLSDGGELLLWGPVTDTELTGTIQGIYSPSSCE